jgi:hypothetical protein
MTIPKSEIKKWLLEYAWAGTPDEQARNVECIMAQDGWEFIDARADQFAGAQWEPGPKAFSDGQQFAMSELYECHDGPHLPDCPMNHECPLHA